ncbi:hypothetical protein BEWA_027650 [Theileria equi strain WA]|uniref:Uncharacterized protein n=1 Tax=Theileria equi strain WA TaxID=1537102 RepID=L0AY45_THEEQ|nr:hypothetical protein BEWA_027650 [Theileria equi strain WA]AFZ79916.1 hypothetical protein BEWA_027650 [Theileria equi strain WA]|eukprot:XP_004829582.1 hypothetical protein BEWA_027650 [Theileria equi strain WA]
MTDFTLDVRDPLVTKHVSVSGGSDSLYIYSKLVPQRGFNVSKVVDGFTTLWVKTDTPLESLTIYRLGNLPVVLLLQLSNLALHFEYKDFSWHSISEEVYQNKLNLDLHRHNFGNFVFDLNKRDLKDVIILSLHDDPYLTTHFKPELGKTCTLLKDGSQVLWEAKNSKTPWSAGDFGHQVKNGDVKGSPRSVGDKCLEFSTHDLNGASKYLRLTALESGSLVQNFFEKVEDQWVPLGLHAYFERRAPKDPQVTTIDVSSKEHPRVFFLQGKPLGLAYNVYFSSLLGRVAKVVDGGHVLWEAKGDEKCIHVTLTHDGIHSHLLFMHPSGLTDLYFENKDGEWKAIDSLPDNLKVLHN